MPDNDGFTIIELMTVVALIGVMSTIAIPIYSKYNSRARTAEAKISLSAMYSAETGFFAEYNTYTMCLRQAGYSTTESGAAGGGGYTPAGHTFYMTGAYFATPAVCGENGTQSCLFYSFDNAGNGLNKCTCPCDVATGVDSDCTFVATTTMVNGQIPGATCALNVESGPLTENVTWGPLANDQFIFGALGQISATSQYFDEWTIDQDKMIDNPVTGL